MISSAVRSVPKAEVNFQSVCRKINHDGKRVESLCISVMLGNEDQMSVGTLSSPHHVLQPSSDILVGEIRGSMQVHLTTY